MNPENTPWKITRPCTANWESMAGDDRKRFCQQCGKHVHNISAMTSRERTEFARPANQQECITYIHRADGTPVDLSIWMQLRRCLPLLRLVRWSALVTLLPAVLSGCMAGARPVAGRMRAMPLHSEEAQLPSASPTPTGEKYETKLPEN